MINHGTFDVYFKTQLIDFLFIVGVVLGGFFIWTLLANFHNTNSFFRRVGYTCAFLLPMAGLFDVFENLVSFFMMAIPIHFSNGLALIYSSFAVIKFGFWVLALVWFILSIVALPLIKLSSSLKLT